MKPKIILCLALALSGGWTGCSTLKGQPAAFSNTAGAEISISEIHMLDVRHGWARTDGAAGFRVLNTINGGQTWTDVTPRPLVGKVWDCQFPKSQTAWLSQYNRGTSLLLTTNGGKSWVPWAPLGVFVNDTHNYFLVAQSSRFFNARDGLVTTFDGGLCQAVYNFFETHDGGMTWKPASLIPPGSPYPDEPGGRIQIGDCDGSAVNYYPPGTVIIAGGDLMDETPKGFVRLSVSTNSGKSWHDLRLPLPDTYRDGLVDSLTPCFFDTANALLPVYVLKQNTNNSHASNVLIFYGTSDGGNTWTSRPGTIESTANPLGYGRQMDVVSARDIFLCNGPHLYATHDGAKSWQTIKPNIDFDRTSSHGGVSQIDFVDATHGWAVVYDTFKDPPWDKYYLYKTSDGGATWKELPLKLVP
jgi:photosystem II stability/assembly factor-like uncharacterized protein